MKVSKFNYICSVASAFSIPACSVPEDEKGESMGTAAEYPLDGVLAINNIQRAMTRVATFRLMASLIVIILAGALLAAPAEARVSGVRLESLSFGCGQLQDRFDTLAIEYNLPTTSAQRKQEILAEAGSIVDQWNAVCRGTFGSISHRETVVVCDSNAVDPLGCYPLDTVIEDRDQDLVADLYEPALGLDECTPDTNADKVIDGLDSGLVHDLVLAIPQGEIGVPGGVTFEEYIAGLADLALDGSSDDGDRENGGESGLSQLAEILGCTGKHSDAVDDVCTAINVVTSNIEYARRIKELSLP